MRLLIVTGMSGGGKTAAIRMLEDDGFYCVDNLPISLIGKFAEILSMPDSEITRAAVGIDVRSSLGGVKGASKALKDAEKEIDKLKEAGIPCEVLFMEADENVLIKRYKETRRVHPLSADGRIEDGIKKERDILSGMRKKADYIIDTSGLLTRDLRQEISRITADGSAYSSLTVTVLSFGFKYGIPADADLVFDVRFLPNPFYVDSLKYLTGKDAPVSEFVLNNPACEEFMLKLVDMISFLIPGYRKEGKYRLVIGIGCTGGQHRSVAIASELVKRLRETDKSTGFHIMHRELAKKPG
ncbi:MAG: RNase adapter RapZ [Lachnospiraceae bacterium]|nr:RNase adapter RapZ [Lachnospiraceae bacterium]